MIREAGLCDLNAIAELHVQSYENHFLPKLGVKLLAKYYKEFIDDKNIFLVYVDEKSNAISGLILGTPASALSRNRFIKNNIIYLSLQIFLLCIKLDKDTWMRLLIFLKSFFFKEDTNKYSLTNDKSDFSAISLLSICVASKYKGKGISKLLIENFEQRLIKSGYEGYMLTVHKTNERANRFYNKLSMSVY
jgi:ribosomal protein S18 acetylase RimI-like enzyme